MAITTYDGLISRANSATLGGYTLSQPLWGEANTNTDAALSGNNQSMQRLGWSKALPGSLPSGVTSYILTRISLLSSAAAPYMVAKMVNLGSLDISGASGTFTDGSQMPTVTELGTSRQIPGAIWMEVTTALNATPGGITVTYKDQDNNTAETTGNQNLTASSRVRTGGWIVLNTGDTGAIDITAAARSSGTTPTGVLQFWGIIPICLISMVSASTTYTENLVTGAFNPVRFAAGESLGVWSWSVTTARAVLGDCFFIGDS